MSRSSQTGLRLADALEDLVHQEAVLLRAGDYPAVAAVQERCAPVVAGLAALAAENDARLIARVQSILALRASSLRELSGDLARVRCELAEIQSTSHRVAKVGPAYGPRTVPNSRLQVAL